MVRVRQLQIFKEIINDDLAVQRAEAKIDKWLDQKALLDIHFIQQSTINDAKTGLPYLVVTIWYTVQTQPQEDKPVKKKESPPGY